MVKPGTLITPVHRGRNRHAFGVVVTSLSLAAALSAVPMCAYAEGINEEDPQALGVDSVIFEPSQESEEPASSEGVQPDGGASYAPESTDESFDGSALDSDTDAPDSETPFVSSPDTDSLATSEVDNSASMATPTESLPTSDGSEGLIDASSSDIEAEADGEAAVGDEADNLTVADEPLSLFAMSGAITISAGEYHSPIEGMEGYFHAYQHRVGTGAFHFYKVYWEPGTPMPAIPEEVIYEGERYRTFQDTNLYTRVYHPWVDWIEAEQWGRNDPESWGTHDVAGSFHATNIVFWDELEDGTYAIDPFDSDASVIYILPRYEKVFESATAENPVEISAGDTGEVIEQDFPDYNYLSLQNSSYSHYYGKHGDDIIGKTYVHWFEEIEDAPGEFHLYQMMEGEEGAQEYAQFEYVRYDGKLYVLMRDSRGRIVADTDYLYPADKLVRYPRYALAEEYVAPDPYIPDVVTVDGRTTNEDPEANRDFNNRSGYSYIFTGIPDEEGRYMIYSTGGFASWDPEKNKYVLTSDGGWFFAEPPELFSQVTVNGVVYDLLLDEEGLPEFYYNDKWWSVRPYYVKSPNQPPEPPAPNDPPTIPPTGDSVARRVLAPLVAVALTAGVACGVLLALRRRMVNGAQ